MLKRQQIATKIMMGIMILMGLAVTSSADAQPARDHRNTMITATRLAQQPSPIQQIAPAECPDRVASAQAAAEGRAAFLSRDFVTAEAAWNRAIALCALPDRYEGRARTREARQGELDGEERLRVLDGALTDYRTAIERQHLVQGFDSSATMAALASLSATCDALEQRIHPHVVAPPPHPPAPACGGANLQTDHANCGTCNNRCAAGQTCTAGQCRTVATPPVVTPTPNRVAPIAMMVSGGVLTITGGLLLWRGLEAQSDADADAVTRDAYGCNTRPISPQCPNYAQGGTTPVSVASWAIPAGATLLAAGVIDATIGAVWLVRTGQTSERPHLGAWYAPDGGGLTLTSTF